jgi:hypothetical protein
MKTIEEAIRAKTAIEGELLKRPGVTGVDVGERAGKPVIRVYVEEKEKAAADGSFPREIDGVPVEFVERRFKAH